MGIAINSRRLGIDVVSRPGTVATGMAMVCLRVKVLEEEVMHLLRNMDPRLGTVETRVNDLTIRLQRVEADRGSPIPRYADDPMCQGCGISEEIEAPRPLPPDTNPVTEALTSAQIQEQYGAASEKDKEHEMPITKTELTLKGCDVIHKNHLGKVISIS